MNILIVSQYFWPENFIINDLVLKIQGLGHEVSVFTGKPNYPEGKIYAGYKEEGVHKELYCGLIDLYRIPLRPRKSGGYKNIALNYLSFVFSGIKHSFSFSKNKNFDVIFVFAPSPITSAIPAIFIKWLTRSHLVLWVQDLWPESVKATGFFKNTILISTLRLIVRFIYFFSDTILVQSKSFVEHILSLVNKNKVIYYPNSVMEIQNTAHHDQIPVHLRTLLDTKFCVLFAGNIGKAQSIETIIRAGEYLKSLTDIKIILVGSGSESNLMQEKIGLNNLNNIIIAGRFEPAVMPQFFSKAACLLVTLKDLEIFKCTIPSKIQAYLAAGKPIIASLNGEGAQIVLDAKAGLVSPSEDAESLANNIRKLYHLPKTDRDQMGESGRRYFLKHFEMVSQTKRLLDIFTDRIGGG